MKRLQQFLSTAVLAGLLFATSAVPATAANVGPPEVNWEMTAPDTVRFHLRFSNPDPFESTLEVSGQIHS